MHHHLIAAIGTAPADLGTHFHDFVVGHEFAVIGTRAADLGADSANARVEARFANHEISRDFADLRAILKKANMNRIGVESTHLQAMPHHLFTNLMAFNTGLKAELHLLAHALIEVRKSRGWCSNDVSCVHGAPLSRWYHPRF